MATRRISLKDRRAQDKRGVDAIFDSPAPAQTASDRKSELVKATYYLRPEQIVALENVQVRLRNATGKKHDKSSLMQEALDLLIDKYRETPA